MVANQFLSISHTHTHTHSLSLNKDAHGLIQRKKQAQPGDPMLAMAEGVYENITIDECMDTIVVNMRHNVHVWDTTLIEAEVVHQWTDSDLLYDYKINPSLVLSNRDMIYYEGWRTRDGGVVENVSSSLPKYEALVPLPKGWVRCRIHVHYKRFTPIDGGKSTKYETLQQIEFGGLLPDSLVFAGVIDGLRKEFVGFGGLMRQKQQEKKAKGKGDKVASV